MTRDHVIDCPRCGHCCPHPGAKDSLPLTDAELADLWHQANGQHYRFARLIEKAHDIKARR